MSVLPFLENIEAALKWRDDALEAQLKVMVMQNELIGMLVSGAPGYLLQDKVCEILDAVEVATTPSTTKAGIT